MGKPIITTDSVGCRDVIEDGKNGFMILPRDVASLARAMHKVLEISQQERTKMGKLGREKAITEFNEKTIIKTYLRIIDESEDAKSQMENRTILITNGNTLSMLSLAGWLKKHGKDGLVAIFITTKLPSSDSNLSGTLSLLKNSGFQYTFFKLFINIFVPLYLKLSSLPFDVPSLCQFLDINVPIHKTENINNEEIIFKIKKYKPQIILSFSATQRFSEQVFEPASRVALNAHFSLLPAYAGLSPYFWYLNNSEQRCGCTLHIIMSKLDAGPIIEQSEFKLIDYNSVMQVALRQAGCVSEMLNRFYDKKVSEKDAVSQNSSLRSYFKHPDRKTVRNFLARGYKFVNKEDLKRVRTKVCEIVA